MLESLKEFWYLWAVVVVLIIVLIPVLIRVSKSIKKRNAESEKLRKDFERIKILKEKYAVITKESAENADAKELCEGVTAVLQYKLEKSQTPDADFEAEEKWRREVFSLFWFNEDVTENSLSYFFRHNGEPLPKEAVNGIDSIGYDKIKSVVSQMYAMCDDKNENVSFDKNRIAELDEKFRNLYNSEEFFEKIRLYIINSI
ncbi:MAG: hypothetical protein IJ289_04775 [Clostridia bacterium]|nr:hypothetical protein [Clostridia bacterium]